MNIVKKMRMKFASPASRAEFLRKDGLKIGNDCEVYPGVRFGTEPYLITIGNHVRITADVRFITHDGGVWVLRQMKNEPELDKFGPIFVGDNVMIGTGATIMPNTSIGDNCIIGAGAVVTKKIPANSVVAGVPGKIIGSVDDYYIKNKQFFMKTKKMNKAEKKNILLKTYNNYEA